MSEKKVTCRGVLPCSGPGECHLANELVHHIPDMNVSGKGLSAEAPGKIRELVTSGRTARYFLERVEKQRHLCEDPEALDVAIEKFKKGTGIETGTNTKTEID